MVANGIFFVTFISQEKDKGWGPYRVIKMVDRTGKEGLLYDNKKNPESYQKITLHAVYKIQNFVKKKNNEKSFFDVTLGTTKNTKIELIEDEKVKKTFEEISVAESKKEGMVVCLNNCQMFPDGYRLEIVVSVTEAATKTNEEEEVQKDDNVVKVKKENEDEEDSEDEEDDEDAEDNEDEEGNEDEKDNEYEIFIHVDEKTLHTILKIDLTKETEEDGVAGLLNEHLFGQNIQIEYTSHEEENYGVRIKLL